MSSLQRLVCCIFVASGMALAQWQAGFARQEITPAGPFWQSGYAARTHPSEGVLSPLHLKVLVLDDGRGERMAFLTADLIAIPRGVSDQICAEAQRLYGFERRQILLNASHTHGGPSVPGNLEMWDWNEATRRQVREYGSFIAATAVRLLGEALEQRQPVSVTYHEGRAGFAVHRRQPTANGIKLGVNPAGPTDHTVPVLSVKKRDGSQLAVLFGYACHNTTIQATEYRLHGDYAAHAQQELEDAGLGGALFMTLCAGDQSPNPRGTPALAAAHGKALAESVRSALAQPGRRVEARLRSQFLLAALPLQLFTREQFQREREQGNEWQKRRAQLWLDRIDQRTASQFVDCPVQAVRLGREWLLVAMGGEVVVEYCLRIRERHARKGLAVSAAGFSNDVFGYVPTKAMLAEGGYEPIDSVVYYGLPSPFAPEVEAALHAAVDRVVKLLR
jgi:neutral ceramidase